MKKILTISLFANLALIASMLGVPSVTATPPPPAQTTILVPDANDSTYLTDHEEVAIRIHALARLKANHTANAILADNAAKGVGVRIRRALVRHKAAMDGLLPAVISDFTLRRVDDTTPFGEITQADTVDTILINADATGH